MFSAVPAMDFDSLYSDYNLDDQDFYAAVSPNNNDSRNKMVSLKTTVCKLENSLKVVCVALSDVNYPENPEFSKPLATLKGSMPTTDTFGICSEILNDNMN